jgi:Predicted flavin-nucleotide-binding protein
MDTTLVVYEENERQKTLCELIGKALGPSVCADPRAFDGDFGGHGAVAIAFSLDNGRLPKPIAAFIEAHANQLETKKIAVICMTDNRSSGARVLKSTARLLPGCTVQTMRLPVYERPVADTQGPNRAAFSEISDRLVDLRRVLTAPTDMPKDMLWEEIERILRAHNTCALCTGHGAMGRVTPIEYSYRDGMLYFLSEGGEKFAHLHANPKVHIAVFREYSDFNSLEGLQLEGTAETIETFCDEYAALAEQRGLTLEKLRNFPVKLNIFKVAPERAEVLKSGFRDYGYSIKQVWTK